jgi:hypothetical protein
LAQQEIVFKKIYFSYAGYLFGYPLATYLDYFAEAEFVGYSCSGITTVDTGGQGFFFSQAHGWRSSLRIDSHYIVSSFFSFFAWVPHVRQRPKVTLFGFVSTRCIASEALIKTSFIKNASSHLLMRVCWIYCGLGP